MNSKKFALIIEGIVKDKRISYLDAVLHYCENNDIYEIGIAVQTVNLDF